MQKYNWNYPTTMWVGENRIKDIGLACKTLDIKKPLLVTDSGLANSEIVKKTLEKLNNENIITEIYSNVTGNPTGTNVNEGVIYYKKKNCDGVIAFGGGSGLDVVLVERKELTSGSTWHAAGLLPLEDVIKE